MVKASHPREEQGLLQLVLVEFLPNQREKARIGNRAHLGTVLLLFTLTGLQVRGTEELGASMRWIKRQHRNPIMNQRWSICPLKWLIEATAFFNNEKATHWSSVLILAELSGASATSDLSSRNPSLFSVSPPSFSGHPLSP